MPPQSVTFDLRVRDGVPTLHAFSFGAPYTVDPSRIAFTATRRGDPAATAVPLALKLGAPALVPPVGVGNQSGRSQDYSMSLDFPGLPGEPGMYDVVLHAKRGFAATNDGAELPFGDWSRPGIQRWQIVAWWPDTRAGDLHLREAQRRFAGRDVYGYGGIVIGCPNAFETYSAATPVHVREVVRDRGQVEELWTGTTVSGGDEMAPHFFAVEPLRLLVDRPAAKAQGIGGSSGSTVERCPAVVLADWQLDVTLSLSPPLPRMLSGTHPAPLRTGMTRDEVAWRNGYPRQFESLDAVRRSDRWEYAGSPFNSFWIEFRDGRVSRYSPQAEQP
jgi:hypothetical protein